MSKAHQTGIPKRALYLMPSARHETAFVTAMDCFTACASALCASVLM